MSRHLPGRIGAAQSQVGSPLPQSEPGARVAPVRVADAFYQFYPSRSTIFFQRAYFANYPRPIQAAGLPGFPRGVPVCRIQAPAEQCVVIRQVYFRVYEHSGIDVNDVIEVESARTTTYFGFEVKIGNRGMTDYNTNLTVRGDVLNYGGNAGPSFPPTPGQGSFYPYAGPVIGDLQNFAYYCQSRQTMDATVQILRPPPFDTRFFSVEISGIVIPQVSLDKVLDRLSG